MAGSEPKFDSSRVIPLIRAVDMATLIFGRDAKLKTCNLLREIDFGDFEGMAGHEPQK
jgi:broad specificity phosphatase PhoE